MDDLIRFYKTSLKSVALALVVFAFFVPAKLEPFVRARYGADSWIAKTAPFLERQFLFVVLLAASEWFIRKHLWRWRWFHPDLDFAGNWEGVSTYTKKHIGEGALPDPVKHEVTMTQDCLSFKINPSPDPDASYKGYWESKATNLVSSQQLVYAYEVHYGGKPNFPDVAFGYEDMRTVQQDTKRRPCVLRGEFYQCVLPGKAPVYSGSVEFRRVGKAKQVKQP